MAKVGGGIRGFARSRGYRVIKLSNRQSSGGQYRYAIRGGSTGRTNMRARNAREAAALIRSASRRE